jgi:hypothetical protein
MGAPGGAACCAWVTGTIATATITKRVIKTVFMKDLLS